MSREIERAVTDEDWETARCLILAALVEQPEDHWLLTRLALTHYEQRDYERALAYSEQALAIAPDCPLALWDYAGALEMLERTQDALTIYERLVQRGIDSLAYDACGEGRAWARGLYADCFYCMGHCFLTGGEWSAASRMLRLHLQQRGPGCRSIYPLKKVRGELRALEDRERRPVAFHGMGDPVLAGEG